MRDNRYNKITLLYPCNWVDGPADFVEEPTDCMRYNTDLPPDLDLWTQAVEGPCALVDKGGEVQWIRGAHGQLIAHFLEADPTIYRLLAEGVSFEQIVGGKTRLEGTPNTSGSLIRLTWKTLNDNEIRLAFFRAMSRAVNSSLILEAIFVALGEVLRQFIPFEEGVILILDESQNRTKVTVHLTPTGQAEMTSAQPIFIGYDPALDACLKNPQAMTVHPPLPISALYPVTLQPALVTPLISKGVVSGFLSVQGPHLTPEHLELLSDVSEQLAVAVENARLYWQTQNLAGRAFLVNQITQSIRQSLDLGEILNTTAREVGQVMGLSRCLIHYWGQADGQAQTRHYQYELPGVSEIMDLGAFATLEKQLFERRTDPLQKYNPFVLNDIRNYPPAYEALLAHELCSLAVFPILLEEGVCVGTISLHQCDAVRTWLTEEIELLQTIAEHVAVALHQANLFWETESRRHQLESTLKELQQTQMQLIQSEKMAVLGQFVAGIAHEVNTPLGTLMSNDETVSRCLQQLATEDEKSEKYRTSALDLLKINRMAAERIMEIVRNLRNFARLDESDLKPVNLHEGLDSTLLLMESSYKNRITIEKHYGTLPLVECFPGLLNQVFMNMLVNACQSIEGPGTITIATSVEPEVNQVEVAITDTGKGIAPENLSRIFDPGFTTKGVGVGTGLGLALCYKIIEKHHGLISVDSTPGQGTRFRVRLPVRHGT